MKKVLYLIIFLLMIVPFRISAGVQVDDSNINSSTSSKGCFGNSCWMTFDDLVGENRNTNRFQAIRVTVYNKHGKKVSNSVDFANSSYQLLNGKTFFSVHNKKSKIDYIKDGDNGNFTFSIEKGANISYLKFPDFIGESSKKCSDLSCLLKNYINQENINLITAASSKFSFCDGINYECEDEDISSYYIVVEPATVIVLDDKSYYGTYYELKWLYNTHPYPQQKYYWARTVVTKYLPISLTLTGINTLEDFYHNVDLDYSDKSRDNSTRDNNDSFGIGVLNAQGLIPIPNSILKKENCLNEVNMNSCGELNLTEPNTDICVLGNDKYYLKSYNDSGKIYCTNSVSTDFNDFYTTFNSSIRSGSYFPMDNLNITTNKTCYIKSSNGLSSVKDWQSSINETLVGNIKLTLGNKTYTLEEKITSETPVCQTWSSGVCTKATMNSTHTYSLNPLVNRFINIQTMQQDVYNYQTATNIDNGGARLTIPLNYLTGIYKYNLNLNESLFNEFRSRITNQKINTKINNKRYELTYTTNKVITDSNLSYSCPYKATQDQCYDEEGSIYPCPVEDTPDPIPDDKCYIDGKVSDCPKTCESDCCDANGNEIACPGGDSVIGNVIYRPISLVEPFPGIDGTGRVPGFNWDRIVKINGQEYTASDYYIRNNRGYKDYEIYQSDPLYVIKLDGNTIREIREYNDSVKNNYNDFNLECQNGEKCISKFLRGIATNPSFSINLISSGTCKSIDYDNFDSCITRKGV